MLVDRQSATEYFKKGVETALLRQQVRAKELTVFYLVNLLVRHVEAPVRSGRKGQEFLLLRFEAALMAGGSKQGEVWRQLGDTALIIAGFFAESLNRALVDIDYYVDMGRMAYDALAGRRQSPFAGVFDELSQKFVVFVDVLSDVSETSGISSNADLLRLYENWARTGSRRAERLLIELGVLPNPAATKFRVQ